jgi:hypothetical protein
VHARWDQFWRLSALLLAAIALAVTPLTAGAKAKQKRQPFNKPEILLQWINDYRRNPEPERLAEAYKAMRDLNLLKDVDAAGIYVGFIAGVIGANPDKADKLISDMFPMPPPDQVIVVKAIAFSGLAEWKDLLGKFTERMPARQIIVDRYLSGKLPVLRDLPLDNPIAVDANWGYYFATGSSEPIQRLVRGLAWSNDKNNVEKLTLSSTIKWTLAMNASRDNELLGYLKTSLPHQPDNVGIPLNDVIESCETFELAHIRKQAMDAIDDLKRKGSEDSRNFAWWGQVGQTALSLGCVGAAVGGQAAAEVPCVVGSALSTAGLKYLGPNP